ncbi:MAG: hypothetical protein QME75_05920 [Deltaproteobacteria bacterium]|nr:hypothetical protein [Deltaproteobacteria bacterium]
MPEIIWEGIDPIVVSRSNREEIRLSLRQHHGERHVDLRVYALDEIKGKAVPTDQGAIINLKLWRHFCDAVARLAPLKGAFPVWVQQTTPEVEVRSVFSNSNVLEKNSQEQIYLEHQDFRGITFILLKTSAISKRGRPCRINRLITIGPILWSQFLAALKKMETLLLNQGLLAEERLGEPQRLGEIYV